MNTEPESLREVAARRHLLFGTTIATSDLLLERKCSRIIRECNLITPEYEMKWDAVFRKQSGPDYRVPDKLINFAQQNGLALHGHTIWWHGAVPNNLRHCSSQEFAQAALDHLATTIRHYTGRIHSWDVVNEALEPDHDRSDGLRQSRFLEVLGPDYIREAFRHARAIDPHALLVLNEMGLEYASPGAERKRRHMISLLERALADGAPIDCLGIQSHIDAVDQPREHPEFRAFLREVDRMGLGVMITELDVSDRQCPRDCERRDRIVADTYRAYLGLVLEESKVLSISTWGLSDDQSWLQTHHPRTDRAPLRPLPLDSACRRKPVWHAIKAAMEGR